MKGISCVIPLSCAKPVINAPNVATNLPVEARLQNFWKIWLDLGAGPKAVQILQEGYTLPFQTRPNLSRNPTVISCYGNPHRNLSLLEALHQPMDKNAIELPRGFQPAIFSPKTQQQVEAYSRLKQSEPLPQCGKIQDGDTGNYQDIPPTRGVGHLNRLQGCLLPYSHTGTVQEISEVSRKRADLSIQSSAFRTVHSTLRVHCDSKGGKADGHTQGYKNPPVPRRLVGEGNIPPGLSPAYTSPSRNVPETGMASEHRKVRIRAQAGFQLCRLPVRPSVRSGPTNTGPMANPSRQNTGASNSTSLSGPRVHVIDRPVNSHRKTGSPRPTTHHSVASQKQLEGTGISGEAHSTTQVIAPALTLVASRKQRSRVNLYTRQDMLCRSLPMHQKKGGALT